MVVDSLLAQRAKTPHREMSSRAHQESSRGTADSSPCLYVYLGDPLKKKKEEERVV